MLLALAVDRAADQDRAQLTQRGAPATPLEDRALGGDQLALVPALPERVLVRAHHAHVCVAWALPAALLSHLEEGVDAAVVGRVAGAAHGVER